MTLSLESFVDELEKLSAAVRLSPEEKRRVRDQIHEKRRKTGEEKRHKRNQKGNQKRGHKRGR